VRRRLATTGRGVRSLALAAIALPLAVPGIAPAQPVAGARDTLRLGDLQAEAVRRDPRARQLGLLAAQDELRRRDLDAERLPALALNAQGQYQSDVVTLPFQLPGGATVPARPHDLYDAHVAARQPLYDPTRAPRREVDRARLAESQARVRASLFSLRQSVNDAYFTALLLESQRAEVETGIADLEAQLGTAHRRERQGAALPSEAATLQAELLRRRQSVAELTASQ
jgi:outer membrane protein TolC